MPRFIQDIKGYGQGSTIKLIVNFIFNPNYHAVLIYRIAHFFNKIKLPIISKILMYINRIFYSVDIDCRADLAGGFVLVHGIGTVIGAFVQTLGPVRVYQGVTIGENNNRERIINNKVVVQPILNEGTVLYANSGVFGPIIMGKNVVIGAGTKVTSDVEDNTIIYCKHEYNKKVITNK